MIRLGIFSENSVARIQEYEAWFGRPVDYLSMHTGEANWSDYESSVNWAIDTLWKGFPREVFWTTQLITKTEGTLYDAGRAVYNQHYANVAKKILTHRPNDPLIWVRTGVEHNGNWMPWSSIGKEADFKKAFYHFSSCFRLYSNRFRVCYNWDVSGTGNPEAAYPGDEFVDMLGVDMYHKPEYGDPADPVAAFNFMRDRPFGLKYLADFGRDHKKPISIPEVGVKSDTMAPFIKLLAQWCEDNNVHHVGYWDSNWAYPGQLSKGQYPATGAAYQKWFA